MISQFFNTLMSASRSPLVSPRRPAGSVRGTSRPGSISLNRTFRAITQGTFEASNSAPTAAQATSTKEAANRYPISVMVMPNSPNSLVARVMIAGM